MTTNRETMKFETQGTYGDSPKFIQLRDDLRTSAAFLCLSPVEQVILIDFIDHYNQATNFDRDPAKVTKPILYTFGMCAVTISKNTFYRSMEVIQEHGFINTHATAGTKRGQATRWLASIRWRIWKPDAAQLRILNGYNRRRTDSIEDPGQLRFPFVQSLQRLNAEASHRAELQRNTHYEENDGPTAIEALTRSAVEDLCNKNGSARLARPRRMSAR